MKKGIIFDMDGTLWDAGASIAEAWNIVMKRRGLKKMNFTADDIHSIMGKTIDGIADTLFGEYSQEERMDITRECLVYENEYLAEHGGELFDKLEEVLKTLQEKYPLYIVSNCEKGYIEGFLAYYGFGKYFKDFESHGNTGLPKGQNIRLVAERNSLTDVIYIGDIQSDYNASKEAGVGFIHAAYGFGTIEEAVLAVSCIAEVPDAIEKYFSR
ncbi:MAG: HAD family hydrolase [Roseburia sp.]|nr:HAD family hydrolase [Roseburia sp.]